MSVRTRDFDRMFGPLHLFRNRLGDLFSDFDRSLFYLPEWTAVENHPRTNLYDAGEYLELKAEVPGLGKDDLKIRLQGNYLELKGFSKTEIPEGYTAHRVERGTVEFSRSFTLPTEVDADKVEASLSNGILTLKLPKAEAAKPKNIAIK